METIYRNALKDKRRIVVKIGSSSLTHAATGQLDLIKVEVLIRELVNLKNQGKDVVLVSSGAMMVGRNTMGLDRKNETLAQKQATASIGQAKLMMIYQKLFSEYNQICSQILMTKHTMINDHSRMNARNTFNELLKMGVIPVVNENDTVSTYEIEKEVEFGDNDTLSAVVAALIDADLLILLSDIDGLYDDDPNLNADARFIPFVSSLDSRLEMAAKGSSSAVGTGGMSTKIRAAKIAGAAGTDMIIANGRDFHILHELIEGKQKGTLFAARPKQPFQLADYLDSAEGKETNA